MPRRAFNDGQEIVQGDLGAISSALELELYDRIIYEMIRRQQNFMFGDSMLCSYVNATTSQVKKGSGFYYDNTQVDPEPMTRALWNSANTNVTHTAAHATLDRIDLICITPARATTSSQSRNFKDASSGAVSSQTMVVETDWVSTLSVVAGTAAGSPVAPATPAGKLALCQVRVTAATGIAGASAYTDVRSRYNRGFKKITAFTAAATLDLDDENVTCNANGGAFALTLPAASSCAGKEYTITKTDSSGNAITLTAAGSDLICGSATQLLSTQYTTLVIYTDGSVWYLK